MTDVYTWINHHEFIYLIQKAEIERNTSVCFVCRAPKLKIFARLYYVDCGDYPEEYFFSIWLNNSDDEIIFCSEPTSDADDVITAFERFSKSHEHSAYYTVKDRQ